MITWQERFNIGVESIDNAHQELFRIINKLHSVVRAGGSNTRWTAAQTIKYVHSYTLRHFQDEEAYMRSINFRDYEAHKAIHTTMREKVIPRLYSRLEQDNYSDESIELFLNVLEKWLTKHIIGHDREIVQKALSDSAGNADGESDAQGMEAASGSVLSASRPPAAAASSPAGEGRRRSVAWLAVTLAVFGAAYAAGGLLVKDRIDKLSELKASSRAEEASLARLKASIRTEAASLADLKAAVQAEADSLNELKAAIQAEAAILADLKSETWGIRLKALPDGTREIILPKGMKYDRHGKIEAGEYADLEEIVVQAGE